MSLEKTKYVSMKALAEMLNISKSTFYDWQNKKSPRYDPTFPKKIRIGVSCVRYSVSEIESWIESKRGI